MHLSPDCVSFLGKDVLEIPEENFELPDFFKILELKSNLIIGNLFTDKTVDYNTERRVLSVGENRTKCIIIIGFLYTFNTKTK